MSSYSVMFVTEVFMPLKMNDFIDESLCVNKTII